ncbi:MAG: GNAT family N-acetyltransferase [Slackia sp.]|nr:GNAT family N-acetyltransferase [Slackia sp.]
MRFIVCAVRVPSGEMTMREFAQGFSYEFVSGPLCMQQARSAARLFCDCVHASNAADYTKRQLEAWAPNDVASLDQLASRLCECYAVVAMQRKHMAGFGTVVFRDDGEAELDMLYVMPAMQGEGLGSRIVDGLEREAILRGAVSIRAFVSLTARSFFEGRGYEFVRNNIAMRRGVALLNHLMRKSFV